MTRDLDRLTGTTFDLLVVGGGIYGLAIASDPAHSCNTRHRSGFRSREKQEWLTK